MLFATRYHGSWKWFEIPFFAMVGILGGLSGALFTRANLLCARLRKNSAFLHANPITEVAVICAVTGVINWNMPLLKGSTTGLITALISPCEEDRSYTRALLCPAKEGGGADVVQGLAVASLIKVHEP